MYVSPSTALASTYVFWQWCANAGDYPYYSYFLHERPDDRHNQQRLRDCWPPQMLLPGSRAGRRWNFCPTSLRQPVEPDGYAGQNAVLFTVGAGGAPGPFYQWLMNGTNLVGQTASTLMIPGASALNIGTYSVIVTNNVGGLSSTNVTLAVNPPAAPSTVALTGGSMVGMSNSPLPALLALLGF